MKKLTKNNGITLIALIITIIVMMILVGVTVTVALNGGLFDTTKRAAIKQEIATMQEIISAQEAKILADKAQNGQLETITVSSQEILSSYGVTNPEVISMVAEPAPEYVTNELVPPTGTCYKLDPSILGVDISRGQGTVEEGTAKDIFILDSDKKIYYIREASIEVTEPPVVGEVSDVLLDYILGQVNPETGVRPGRSFFEIIEFGSTGNVEGFLNVPEELGVLEVKGMEPISETEVKNEAGEVIGTEGIVLFTFDQTTEEYIKTYQFQVNVFISEEGQTATTSVTYGVKLIDTKEYSRIGKIVKYGEGEWTVLYDDESHGLQLTYPGDANFYVSQTGVNISEVAVDLNQDETIDQLESHLYVYNNGPDLVKKALVSSYNSLNFTFIAKDSNGNCLLRTLGSNPLISNFGEDVYKTVVVSEETFPGYGETSTWFEDKLNLEKNADGTGYIVKGTDIPFEFRTTDGITLGDSEAIEYLADYTSNSEYLDLMSSQSRRSISFNSGSIVGGFSSHWRGSIECEFTITPDSAVADELNKINSGFVMLLDQEKFAEFEEAAKNSSDYGNGSADNPWNLDKYVSDTE